MGCIATTVGEPSTAQGETMEIAEYRARAEKCSRHAELTNDLASKLHWLAMAESWLVLADNLAKKDVYGYINRAA